MRPVEQYHVRVVRILVSLAAIIGIAAITVSVTAYVLDTAETAARSAIGSYHLRSLQLGAEIQLELDRLGRDIADREGIQLVNKRVPLRSALETITPRVESLRRLQQQFTDAERGSALTGLEGKLMRLQSLRRDTDIKTLQDNIDSFRLSVSQFEKLHHMRADELINKLEADRDKGAGNTIIGALFIVAVSLTLIAYAYRVLASSLARQLATEAQLETSEKRFRDGEKLRAIGQLVGGVAHDFNNLLTVIIGHAETTMSDERLPDRARSALGEILHAGTRAADLTRRLLTFSSRQPVARRAINLNELVTDAISMLKPLIGDRIDLSVSLEQTPLIVEADPSELQQVLTNLIVNARDAVSGRGTITISTAAVTAAADLDLRPGRYCRIAITDDGCGMSADTLAKLFEPFFTTKGLGEGTGLGLSVVHGIVSACGGTINVTSELGEGTHIDIYLPRCAESQVPSRPAAESTLRGGNETLLLVEDERAILDLTARNLTRLGYRVITAGNGQEAIMKSRAYPAQIDLVVSDVIMPRVNGPDAVKEILTIQPEARVIYISGYTDDVVLETGATTGGAILVRKPFNLDELARLIRASLDENRSAVA